ncbi:sugar transferase [Qipengyuania sp. DGS5-3]|uniref:sugar transferase n=1 Tax=Qipengyuania sp. DGS5-3 TaxID=3349632 RepID=UPI0036D21D0C
MTAHSDFSATPKEPLDTKPLANSATDTVLSGRPWYDRSRVQMPMLIVVVLALQLIAVFSLTGSFGGPVQTGTSLIGTQIANILGAFFFRKAQRVPGARSLRFLLPSLTANYVFLIGCLFAFRIPYSVWLVGLGFVGALLVLWFLNSRSRAAPSESLHLIETAQTKELLSEIEHIPFRVLPDAEALSRLSDGAVIVDLREELSPDWERAIAQAVLRGIPVFHVKQAYESLTGKVRFDHLSENHFGSLVPSLSYLAIKRIIDVFVALAGLIVLSVPMSILALAIRLDSPGPAIFKHTRMGYRGRFFKTYKFRTMATRIEDDGDRESQITQANDPRVTRIGRFLRDTRLDELPQLLNVVMGEMSLIGPRPEAAALSEWYHGGLDFYEYRHIVRPGITGWAQVNQGHVTDMEDIFHKTQYDFYYIKNISFWLDFLIAIKTIEIMFSKRGAR